MLILCLRCVGEGREEIQVEETGVINRWPAHQGQVRRWSSFLWLSSWCAVSLWCQRWRYNPRLLALAGSLGQGSFGWPWNWARLAAWGERIAAAFCSGCGWLQTQFGLSLWARLSRPKARGQPEMLHLCAVWWTTSPWLFAALRHRISISMRNQGLTSEMRWRSWGWVGNQNIIQHLLHEVAWIEVEAFFSVLKTSDGEYPVSRVRAGSDLSWCAHRSDLIPASRSHSTRLIWGNWRLMRLCLLLRCQKMRRIAFLELGTWKIWKRLIRPGHTNLLPTLVKWGSAVTWLSYHHEISTTRWGFL